MTATASVISQSIISFIKNKNADAGGNMNATQMIPTGQFPLGKLHSKKIPAQDKFNLDNSHPGKLPPRKVPPGQLPPRKTPNRIIPTWKNFH